MDVVDRGIDVRTGRGRVIQVIQIRAADMPTGITAAIPVDWVFIFAIFAILAQIDRPALGKQGFFTGVFGRNNTVHNIYSGVYRFEHGFRAPYPHNVTQFLTRQ